MLIQGSFLGIIADKLAMSAVVAVVGGILMWPFRKVKKEWTEATNQLSSLKSELEIQRTNHLTHIENNTKATVEAIGELKESFEKVADVLDSMHLDQRLLMGRLEK